MMNLHALLKQKSYSDLTETEQTFVLKTMSSEDYEAEHLIVTLSEKMKQNQAHFSPNPALRAELLAKMQKSPKPIGVWYQPYRVAASVLFCLGLCYFWQKNKVKPTFPETVVETKALPKEVIEPQKATLPTDMPKPKQLRKKKNLHHTQPVVSAPKQTEEEALAASFNRKNPNLAWQTDDENAEVLDKPMLQLDNDIENCYLEPRFRKF